MNQTQSQFLKYCGVGLANTSITALVIWSATRSGAALLMANTTGYVVGILSSLVMNTFFTFGQALTRQRALHFFGAAGLSYLANLVVIGLLWRALEGNDLFLQGIGMVTYTLVGFLLNKFWVMRG